MQDFFIILEGFTKIFLNFAPIALAMSVTAWFITKLVR